ncbi:MAG TPA: hypothetical protein DHW71_13570 [Gammaproteobacteria bacterium]|nr:hypothetical protein [Gammaproteobacteria bacterium]MEC8011186.1 hypothetical protein [Pseudomonadota bacterium]HBF08546.1 hypothetical protein [Gammaproteobacteria bacterium]HCK94018.1 hypothetical protein [Gammaproteobacteria bacterium]|tara:strand:- start:492 stop:734 length:243 start_codon:yes stop_codon:yes gene_type:complete
MNQDTSSISSAFSATLLMLSPEIYKSAHTLSSDDDTFIPVGLSLIQAALGLPQHGQPRIVEMDNFSDTFGHEFIAPEEDM